MNINKILTGVVLTLVTQRALRTEAAEKLAFKAVDHAKDKIVEYSTKQIQKMLYGGPYEHKHVKVSDAIHTRAFSFDHKNSRWADNPDYNEAFLKAQQNYWNDRLRARGYVFLNEVLDTLGLPLTQEGQTQGWSRGDEIYFGKIVHQDSIDLYFNVQGEILDKLPA